MKTRAVRRTIFKSFNYFTLAAVFILAVTALALPLRSAKSGSPEGRTLSDHASKRDINYLSQSSRYGFRWMPNLALAESVAVFASDCTTPKSSFAQGEIVCAITDGVTLGDGTYNLNWVDPQPSTTNGGTITQNPQTFLFALPTNAALGTWKATIGRTGHSTLPDDSSIIGTPPTFEVTAGVAVSTFAGPGCTTPKTAFVLGDEVCVRVSGLAVNTDFPNKINWSDPEGLIRQTKEIDSDPETDTFPLPTDPTSVVFGGITVDNRGTWLVSATRNNGRPFAAAKFTVSDPAEPVADVFVNKTKTTAETVAPGGSVAVSVVVGNGGPDDANNVGLVDTAPSGATLTSFTQNSGPQCLPANSGACTIATMLNGERAEFTAIYEMGTGTGTFSTSATASGTETDTDPNNNTATTEIVVAAGGSSGGDECSIGCPGPIETPANTTEGGQDGAIVHFSPPSGNDECGTITVDHCNDCFFPEGTTTVTATAGSGESCSFTVTVTPPGTGTTISCPSNKTADADANACSTNVSVGTATATGTNVTVVGYRSDGQPMYNCDPFGNCTRISDAPFPAGTTTIRWYAYSHDEAGPYTGPADVDGNPINPEDTEEAHRTGSATCTQTVMVNDVTPPVIAATSSTVSADENCEAVIPDYSSTVTDNCACGSSDTSEECEGHPFIEYTQTPAAGTVVGPGAHNVHIEASDGSTNNNGATKDVTFTVEDTTAPAIVCPASISTTTDPGTCSAVVDPGTATATDNCDTSPTITGTRSDSQALNAPYPKGTTTITWRATDDDGNYSECEQTVTVNDDEAPVITFNGQTPSMWPPNHNYRNFTNADFISSVSDNCDSLSVNDVYITKVTSDEAEESLTLGDGLTFNDMVIAADCKSVQLRAERVNTGNGRVYTIHFKVVDSSGNVTTGTAKVHSPKNQGQTAGDDAVQYTVTSSCP